MDNILLHRLKTLILSSGLLFILQCSSHKENILNKEMEILFAEKAKKFKEQSCFEARYNPPLCDCPHFELKLGTEWVRTEIEPSSRALDAYDLLLLNAEADARDNKNEIYRIAGKISFSKKRCASNALCFDFDFEGFCEDSK